MPGIISTLTDKMFKILFVVGTIITVVVSLGLAAAIMIVQWAVGTISSNLMFR